MEREKVHREWRRGGRRVLAVMAAAGILCGCSNPWEEYEDSLYRSLKVPGAEVYAEHTDLLRQVVAQFQDEGRKPPPGVLAEYGFYLARVGKPVEAKKYFRAEMAAYPESAVFVTVLERTIEGRRAFTPRDDEKSKEFKESPKTPGESPEKKAPAAGNQASARKKTE